MKFYKTRVRPGQANHISFLLILLSLFLQTVSADELLINDGSRIRVAARARSQGADVTLLVMDGMWHVPIGNGTAVPELQLAYDEMIEFFKRNMGI